MSDSQAQGYEVVRTLEAAVLAQSTPEEFRLGCWACQDMLTVDVAPGGGPRSENGDLFVPDQPGLGFAPDEKLLEIR